MCLVHFSCGLSYNNLKEFDVKPSNFYINPSHKKVGLNISDKSKCWGLHS